MNIDIPATLTNSLRKYGKRRATVSHRKTNRFLVLKIILAVVKLIYYRLTNLSRSRIHYYIVFLL